MLNQNKTSPWHPLVDKSYLEMPLNQFLSKPGTRKKLSPPYPRETTSGPFVKAKAPFAHIRTTRPFGETPDPTSLNGLTANNMGANNTTTEDLENLITTTKDKDPHPPNTIPTPRDHDWPSHKVGGRLLEFSQAWEASTSDKWVLSTIQQGYLIEFHRPPHDHFVPSPRSPRHKKHHLMQKAIQHLLEIGAIEPVPSSDVFKGCYSVLFIVPKKDGSWRAVLDLKWVNKFITKRRFRMETLRSILDSLRHLDFLVSLDLREAYLHIPIHPSHRRFLRFCYHNNHFQYRALPFGLSSAPRVFTKIMISLVAQWRLSGIHVHPYLDDLLLRASSYDQAKHHTQQILTSLAKHGFQVNHGKSHLEPSQLITHLGAVIDTNQGRISLTPERVRSILQSIRLALRSRSTNVLLLARIQGLMIASIDCVPWARFHSRELQWFLLPYQRLIIHKITKRLTLPPIVKQSFQWWMSPSLLKGRRLWPPQEIQLTTDASLRGWGATLQNSFAQGKWNIQEQTHSINFLELRAIRLALLSFAPQVKDNPILIRTDNMSAKAHINRQGGTKSRSLMRESQLLLQWSEQHLLSIRAEHIKGTLNTRADWLSRQDIDQSEWCLHPQVFRWITQKLGTPQVDLFASPINNQVPRFYSHFQTQGAEQIDALHVPWPREVLYAFPPTSMINRCLKKARKEKSTLILIAPHWPRRPWFSELISMTQRVIKLPIRPDLLSQGQFYHPDPQWLNLHAWKLNAKT